MPLILNPPWKGYQPDSFSYGFHMVWTVFRHNFRLLFWKMSEKDHIASVDGWVPVEFCMRQQLGADLFSLSTIEKATVRLKCYQLFIVKTTWGLIIKNVWHVSTNFTLFEMFVMTSLWITEQNVPTKWRFLDIKIIFMKQNKHLLCNWESHECKHPNIIKGKRFIIAFLTFVTNLLGC